MLTESEIREMLEKNINTLVKLGKASKACSYDAQMRDFHTWWVVDAICTILGESSCPIWNRIVKECPNLGENTEC